MHEEATLWLWGTPTRTLSIRSMNVVGSLQSPKKEHPELPGSPLGQQVQSSDALVLDASQPEWMLERWTCDEHS